MSVIPFIIQDEKQKGFQVTHEAKTFLQSIKTPIGIVSVVGKYRTGKSYLLNKVMLPEGHSFSVGSTINACTKGLWMYKSLVRMGEIDCLIVDTEGLGGVDENKNHDIRIFMLAILLSSLFIYNSKGTIDENALQNMSLVINLANNIKVKEFSDKVTSEDISKLFPKLLWVLRDFSLKLEDSNKNEITMREQLENSLKDVKGVSENIQQKNRIRKILREFFPDRECYCLARPSEDENTLQNLLEAPENTLRPEFIKGIAELKKMLYGSVPIKSVNGKKITGADLAYLAESYANGINEKGVPVLQTAWNYMCENNNSNLINKLVDKQKDQIKKTVVPNLPQPTTELLKNHEESVKYFSDLFSKEVIGDNKEDTLRQLKSELGKQHQDLLIKNGKYSDEKNKNMLEKFRQKIKGMLVKGEITTVEGLQKIMDQAGVDFGKEVVDTESKEKLFKEWRDKVETQLTNSLLEDEKHKQESTKKFMSEKIDNMFLKLQEKEKEIATERKTFDQKQEEFMKERDSALDQAAQLRNKLSQVIKDKMRFEHDAKTNYTNMENQQLEKLKQKHKEQTLLKEKMNQQEASLGDIIKNLKLDNEKLKDDMNRHKSDFEKMKISKQALENENQDLEEKNKIQKVEMEDLKRNQDITVSELNNENEYLKEQLKQMNDLQMAENELKKEKQQMKQQIEYLKKQLEDSKKTQESLITALGKNKSENFKGTEMIETNKNLAAALERVENRCAQLDNKNRALKKYQRQFKSSVSIQCSHCRKYIQSNLFESHLNFCTKNDLRLEDEAEGIINDAPAQEISVIESRVVNADKEKPQVEQLINVKNLRDGQAMWQVSRRTKHVQLLQKQLEDLVDTNELPVSAEVLKQYWRADSSTPYSSEEKRRALEKQLNDLAGLGCFNSSEPFLRFLRSDSLSEWVQSDFLNSEASPEARNLTKSFSRYVQSSLKKSRQSVNDSPMMESQDKSRVTDQSNSRALQERTNDKFAVSDGMQKSVYKSWKGFDNKNYQTQKSILKKAENLLM